MVDSSADRREGLRAFRDLLDRAPEKEGSKLLNGIEERTGVFPPAPDLQDLDRSRGERIDTGGENPVLLWNHRWEAEKGPERFGSIVRSLIAEGIDFKLILAGPTGNSEGIRQKLADEFPERVLFAKKFDDREAYIQALYRSDLCLVTSDQDFFGLSVVEAMYLQVVPILPDRLAYPEHLSEELRERLLYRNEKEALGIAHKLLKKGRGELPEQVRGSVAPYDIRRWIDRFDQELERVARYQHG